MIQLTVALPVFNSKKIAWIALESLCNQKGIDFDWELIIMEEEKNSFGQEEVSKFIKRLKAVGCRSLKYVPLDYRISLPQKWKQMADLANENSKAYVFCAADDYSPPNKLKMAYDAIKLGYDWVQYQKCLMYDIISKKHIYYDGTTINRQVGSIAACRTASARKLPESFKAKGVDHWLFDSIRPEFVFTDKSDNWEKGFATDGYNNISVDRKKYYQKIEFPFLPTTLNIKDIVSKEVLQKLNSL